MPVSTLSPGSRSLLEQFRGGKRTALARAISVVEDERSGFQDLLHALHADLGGAHRIGVTGPPGAGKSTLNSGLISDFRGRGESVGVVAVDPTSPYTGGALLGDRIRMNRVAEDREVFIRSMATRGSLGGLAVTTKEVADVMDAFGFDRLLMETVGVGQSELDIVAAADTTVVVLVPESGDSVQAMKAGLMEIADIFVANKADRPGADRLARDLRMTLHLRRRRDEDAADADSWKVPVLQTVAERGEGLEELAEALDRHRAWLRESGELARRREARLLQRVREVVQRRLLREAWMESGGEEMLADALPAMLEGEETPYGVAARIVRAALR